MIANKILKCCNFHKKKNKNNDTSHKKEGGKLMNTLGLPVYEFLEKKHLTKKEIILAMKMKRDFSQVHSKYQNSIKLDNNF